MKTLFDKTKINQMELKNRFIRGATWENMADEDGHVTDKLFKVYEDLAKGEVGLIITSYAFIMKDEQPNPGMLGIYDDDSISEYRRLTDMVHSYGSCIAIQLVYGGSQTFYRPDSRVIWGPSAVPEASSGVIPKEMNSKEIQLLIKAFGDAAERAKEAGFDGVEIHAAHGYLLGQWLSPLHNQRTDEYGGSIENRARIILDVYKEIRQRVGKDYAILIKINAEDFVPGGMDFKDCRYVCRELANLGINAIEISGGIMAAKDRCPFRPKINSPEKEAYFLGYAARVAEEIEIPIILIGGLRSYSVLKQILQQTKIEYFGFARPLLADPFFIKRWVSGDYTSSPCISCNQCRTKEGNICVLNRK